MSNGISTEQMTKSDSAGRPASAGTVLSPAEVTHGYAGGILSGLISLFKGMFVTLGYFFRPSTVVTRQYPENRATLKMYDRFRSRLNMIHDADGYHNCTACGICQTACPNASINVVSKKDAATAKKVLDRYIWRLDSCTFCNACVDACPFGALKMSGEFEAAVYDRRLLVYALNRYAGPTAAVLKKVVDPEERKKQIEPCGPYSGYTVLDKILKAGLAPAAGAVLTDKGVK